MKVFNGLSLSDQKIMVENFFIWDLENGDKPERKIYKDWVRAFFYNEEAIKYAIDIMQSDIDLEKSYGDWDELFDAYERTIEFLKQFLSHE